MLKEFILREAKDFDLQVFTNRSKLTRVQKVALLCDSNLDASEFSVGVKRKISNYF